MTVRFRVGDAFDLAADLEGAWSGNPVLLLHGGGHTPCARSLEAAKIISSWEGMIFEGFDGQSIMRACNHQVQAPGFVGVIQSDHPLKRLLDFLTREVRP